ncbi:MAG: DALR anticodon-binding domain-containing protein, partial [bacterium]|nr:DALR anticodon-binding domain-containing protein [bacterium]
FSRFYDAVPVLEEGEARALRLALVAATAQVIKNGLWLLGIEVPERM